MSKLARLLVVLGAGILSGQEILTGIVVDQSGARIPIADVKLVRSGSNQVVARAASRSDGSFVILAAPAQEYELRVETQGFKVARVKIGKSEPGQTINIGNVVMEVLPADIGVDYFPGPIVPVIRFPVAEPLLDIDRNVCEILKDKPRFLNAEIRLRAEVAPYGLDTDEHLFDSNCPGVWLGFGTATSAVTHDWTYRTMMGYLEQQYSASATLRGKLDYYLLVGSEPIYRFLVEEVSELTQGSRSGIVYPKRKK